MSRLTLAAHTGGRALHRAGAWSLASLLEYPPLRRYLTEHTLGRYYNFRFKSADPYADQGYDLLSTTFNSAELESLDAYHEELRGYWNTASECWPVIIGRIHKWAYAQELIRSRGSRMRLPSTEAMSAADVQVVATVSGSFIALDGRDAIGALGHLATHELVRGGQGHGTALNRAFEEAIIAEARKRRRHLRLFVLESLPEARAFWARQGYRGVEGVRYCQPAFDFDPATGRPRGEALPEYLMVKPVHCSATIGQGGVEASGAIDDVSLDPLLLKRTVLALYKHWYVPDLTAFDADACAQVKAYLFDNLFANFARSLPPAGTALRLLETIQS